MCIVPKKYAKTSHVRDVHNVCVAASVVAAPKKTYATVMKRMETVEESK